jgi:outer membrane murein-binding lipoprotein Lpp
MTSSSSQVDSMDSYLSGSIEGLRNSMEKGFDRVERRIDTMVSKDVLSAEVERLNQRDDHLESKMEAGFAEIKAEVSAGFSAIASRDVERDVAAKERDDKRDAKFARRMTWTLTAVGLAFTAFQVFVASLLHS